MFPVRKQIIPPKLNNNDKAVILSPSGCVDSCFIKGAERVLEGWGLNVEIGTFAREQYGRYGGTVEQRVADLQRSIDDDSVKLIFCSRGGYGIVQMLEKINFDRICNTPKWIVGYSDITALHLGLAREGIVSLHAPMARHLTDHPYASSTAMLHRALFSDELAYDFCSSHLNRPGSAEGCVVGGNLAVLTSLVGTPFMNLPDHSILFIEDIGEPPYKIDRMMWQLKLSGVLQNLSGLIVGQFSEYEEDMSMRASVYESIHEIVSEYPYPVAFDFPVGHVKDNYPMLHGAKANFTVTNTNVNLMFRK